MAEGGVASIGVPFMAPLVCAPRSHTFDEEESGKHSSRGSSAWVTFRSPEELSPPQSLAWRRMADHGSKLNDGSFEA